ncbi:MAG: signal recognition particle protein [bacterium]
MFNSLSDRLSETFKKFKGQGTITEKNINDGLREVKLALLEADVNFRVVKTFISRIKEKAVGQEVIKSISPDQQLIKIVNDELVEILGGDAGTINFASPKEVTVIMMVGLQGSGKTTSAGKLARRLEKDGKKTMLVAADIYRPAAINQLETLAKELKIPCYSDHDLKDPVEICRRGFERSEESGIDCLILDTAGRLQIDETLMKELQNIKKAVPPHEVLFVADAMTGQEAVNVAKSFNEQVGLDGVVLTKVDGDARGGAALSIRMVVDKPVKFIGIGEKLDAFEPFHPDRIASSILGMGDILSLVEKAETVISEQEAIEFSRKIRENSFTLDDFLAQLRQIRKMGPLDQLLGMIPGVGNKLKGIKPDEKEFVKIEAVILSMTRKERNNHKIINGSRRKRIAQGSGTRVSDVNRLLKQFSQMRKMMKTFSKAGKRKNFNKSVMPYIG